MTNRERAKAWISGRRLSDAPWAGESHVTALTALLDDVESDMKERAARLVDAAVPIASKDREPGRASPWSTLIACAANIRDLK